jgi:RND family efflux transporter MFP subunit
MFTLRYEIFENKYVHTSMLKLSPILLLFIFISCSKERPRTKPTVQSITESVYASGTIKAIGQYSVYATVSGILQSKLVAEGDTVVQGQTLFQLENVTSGLNTENSRLALELTKENSSKGSDRLQEIEASVNLARDKYLLDSSIYQRQKKLWEQNVGSQIDFEQKQLSFNASKNNYQAARNKLAQAKLQLQNDLKRAEINYDINQKFQKDYSIRSAINGRVYDILKDVGELITPQTPIAIIGKTDTFQLVLEVDENDIVRIKQGQTILVTMDSYKGQTFEAVVDVIYPIMNERSRTFTIEAHFTNPPPQLFPNLTVEANIIIQTRNNVITIPKEYLFENNFVFISKDEKREVKTGLRDYKKVEITGGLDTEQVIYLPQ